MNENKIHHPILRQWWEQEFQGRDNPSWPFCDAAYSTVMPGADFTVAIRELLVNQEFEAIRELLWLTSSESEGWRIQLEKMVVVFGEENYDGTTEGRMKAESDAVVALGLRASFARMRGEGFVIARMARHSSPLWRLDSSIVEILREMPPTFRDMVTTAVSGKAEELLSFRPQSGYGERCYGNNAEWNLRFLEHTGWFRPVSDKRAGKWMWVDHFAQDAIQETIEISGSLWTQAGEKFFEERWGRFLEPGVTRLMKRRETESLADWLDRSFEMQWDVVSGLRDKKSGNDRLQFDLYPAWEIICRDENSDWKQRWKQAGGRIYPSLLGETAERAIALKSDPIWRALGNPEVFPDGLGIDHPPFYCRSGLTWNPIDKTECILLALLSGTVSSERATKYVETRRQSEERLKQALIRAEEDYARTNSPIALLEQEKERQEWWGVLRFSEEVVGNIKRKLEEGNREWLTETEEKIKMFLRHQRLSEKPTAHGALLRAQGHIMEAKGLRLEAEKLYGAALNIDPKAGCRKDLARLKKLIP